MNDEELSSLIKRNAERHPASERLRAAVQTQITLHAAGQKSRVAGSLKWLKFIKAWLGLREAGKAVRTQSSSTAQVSLAFVGGVLLTLALVWMMPRMLPNVAAPQSDVADLLNLHVRSMGAGPLFQVASSDRHMVKPWFQGKLDYAPEVPDLREAGFDLLGGRIDKLDGHDTAALAYQLRKHIISAYVLPSTTAMPVERLQRRGFNILHWSDGVMQVWAVTDANASELEGFGSAWRSMFYVGTSHEVR